MHLYVTPSGSKTWRLRYFKPNGKEGMLIIGKYSIGLARWLSTKLVSSTDCACGYLVVYSERSVRRRDA